MLEQDLGKETALLVARFQVMFLKRPGGQSQFSTRLRSQEVGLAASIGLATYRAIEAVSKDTEPRKVLAREMALALAKATEAQVPRDCAEPARQALGLGDGLPQVFG